METPEPTIDGIIDAEKLRWIFVGGKGGVGKTTCSCAIATELAKFRERVLILSTDPAHNLSDAFDQKFSKIPTKVKGFENLFAMEIDPNLNLNELEEDLVGSDEAAMSAGIRQTITQLMTSFPGVDEYMSYTEVFRLVSNMDYSVVVFDTAPTGHTLRLLAFPEAMEKSLSKVVAMKNQFAPFLTQMMGLFGMQNLQSSDLTDALESRLPIVKEITRQFKDPEQTTFVCVCIPEFLSMYETERLIQVAIEQSGLSTVNLAHTFIADDHSANVRIAELVQCFQDADAERQELTAHDINVNTVIVNQLLFPNLHLPSSSGHQQHQRSTSGDPGSDTQQQKPVSDCRMCLARHRIQCKYLEQILELYEDMHVIQLPQLEHEVRGVPAVCSFANLLRKPFHRH